MINLHQVRRGQVFNFTLTELILLILFILLLLLWFITDKKNKELKEWSRVTGIETSAQYEDLFPNFPDTTNSPDWQDRLIVANKENKKLKEEIKELKGLGRNPPCWPKGWPTNPDYENADRIFNVLLLGVDKLAVIADYKEIYKDQYKLLPINKSILSTNDDFKNNRLNIISSNKFTKSFDRLLEVSKKEVDIRHNNLTLQRDCRHEVRLFFENESISSKEYIRLHEDTVQHIFDTFRFREDNYLDYLTEYKQ